MNQVALERSPPPVQLSVYNRILVAFSGGKDSLSCLLLLIEWMGLEWVQQHVELWHHLVDGVEGKDRFFDWGCTADYCRAIANHFNVPIYFSWLDGGFRGELMRWDAPKAATYFETPQGLKKAGGTSGKTGRRRLFPQQSGSLSNRWCSSYLKIDVMATAIRNQRRFDDICTLTISGERAAESPGRAKLLQVEGDRAKSQTRYVDRLRPILYWTTEEVWALIEKYKITPHPAYYLGFGRCSCRSCIFLKDEDWATLHQTSPEIVWEIASLEQEFGTSIARPTKKGIRRSVLERAAASTPRQSDPMPPGWSPCWEEQAEMSTWQLPIVMHPWQLPSGAYGDLGSGSQ